MYLLIHISSSVWSSDGPIRGQNFAHHYFHFILVSVFDYSSCRNMPAPKTKAAATTATLPKSKAPKSGTSTPTTLEPQDATLTASTGSGGRPDKAAYDAEQETFKKNIDALNTKMVCRIH